MLARMLPRIVCILLLCSALGYCKDAATAVSSPTPVPATVAEAVLPMPAAPALSAPAPAISYVSTAHKLPEAPTSHKFFDHTNIALHLTNFLLQTGDLATTRAIIDRGGVETNPLARPFVQRGIGGQVVASYAIGTGGTLLASYWMHRTGHHRIERFLPIAVSAVEGLALASNARLLAGRSF